jgi:type II pantothenate kinase
MTYSRSTDRVPFCRLRDRARYRPCPWDLRDDAGARSYWSEFFREHLETILGLGIKARIRRGADPLDVERQASLCKAKLGVKLDSLIDATQHTQPLTMLVIDGWRDEILREHGFHDCFVDLKHSENANALTLLPTIIDRLDPLEPHQRLDALIRGIFAGNIFDMGAKETAQILLDGGLDFFRTLDRLPARPWLIDDFDALSHRLLAGEPHHRCVFFVDNAGSDFVLGAVPMIRWLAMRGTHVVIAANELPALNDMTVDDVRSHWPAICEQVPSLLGLPIEIVSTGTGEPMIDLSRVSHELNVAAASADLVILEGMGRAIESNLEAEFDCDAVNIGMLKDNVIARTVGGRAFDVVLKFRRAVASSR